MSFFPFDANNLAAGPGRFLYALGSVTIPTKVTDIIDSETPYAPKTGWVDGGGTVDAPSLARNLTVQGFQYQQSTGNVVERPTDIERSVTVPFGELTPETLEIIEQTTQAVTAAGAAASSLGSGVKVPFGTIHDLGFYRVALIWRFQESQGVVTESGAGTPTRGRIAMWVGHKAAITGDSVSMAVDEGAAWQAPVTFRLYPDSSITTEGSEYGFWWLEDGTQTLP